jgi:hypothetical protein
LAIPLTPQRDNFDIFKKCFDGKKSKPWSKSLSKKTESVYK